MALQRGKKHRRPRRARDRARLSATPAPATETLPETKPRRQPKPLAQRSPILAAALAVLILAVGIYFVVTLNGSMTTKLVFLVFYVLAAAMQGFLAYRIYRARGSWR
jgi:hypothetical protein